MKFSRKYFHGTLASSVYHLTIAKYSWENFRGTLKNRENHKSLAQQIFPHLRYDLQYDSQQLKMVKNSISL